MPAPQQAVETVASEQFGLERLRPVQSEAMAAAVDGRDVLLVLPTGGGKSAVYQVPAVLRPGPTVVVTPLLALAQDQILAIRGNGQTAVRLSSAESASERLGALADLAAGLAEFVFVTPETLCDPEVVSALRKTSPSLLAVDEAHCISAWGHDFRPDYLTLGLAARAVGRPPIVALTATASPPVRDDIVARLGLVDPLVLVRGLDRPNVELEAVRHLDEASRERAVVERVAAMPKGTGIVYVPTRRDTLRWASLLDDRGHRTAAYHGGMPTRRRSEVHEAFVSGELEIVVATSAFGMGIDKADVRLVLHTAAPESLDAYLQESGRAGRDGDAALASLHHRDTDWGLRRFLSAVPPRDERVRKLLQALRATGAVTRRDLAVAADVPVREVRRVVGLLEEVGAARQDVRLARPIGTEPVDDVVARAVAEAERHRDVERSRLEMVRAYVDTTACRRQFLLGYFGERLTDPCGRCDTCRDGADSAASPAGPFDVGGRVTHQRWGRGTVMTCDEEAVVVLFESVGYKTLSVPRVRTGLLRAAG